MRTLALLLLGFALPQALQGQEQIRVVGEDGSLTASVPVSAPRGYAVFSARELRLLDWEVEQDRVSLSVRARAGWPRMEFRSGSPFLRWFWDGGRAEEVQLAEVPFADGDAFFLPTQVLGDILPWKLPDTFRYQASDATLTLLGGGSGARPKPLVPGVQATRPTSQDRPLVVIDPGHGGRDPGSRGPAGTQEKDVALQISLALADVLRARTDWEIQLTRDTDVLVPIWRRGEWATERKADGSAGVFISVHANAVPNSRATRGFETYFLSEARTEHERRVAALENAAAEFETDEEAPPEASDLGFILSELRNLDHQHWSALLAQMIQDEMKEIHPGPNRGVKQGPLAVITNALMPAVLVEVGFITNPEEERLLRRRDFQTDAAEAIAEAVVRFLDRYPPGASQDPGSGGP
jgi:N-acetylmuramoyl-L-alanine amidase